MSNDQLVITYYKLSEQEKRRRFLTDNAADYLRTKLFASGYAHLVILQSDGTVLAMGDNDCGQCDTGDWTDVIKVAAGDYHTVGLRRDGTVLAAGDNSHGQCNVSAWRGITDIFAEKALTIGVQADGSIIVTAPAKPIKETAAPAKKEATRTVDVQDDPQIDQVFFNTTKNGQISIWRYNGQDTEVTIPARIHDRPVSIIGSRAFKGCKFSSVKLPDLLSEIQSYAFSNCRNLRSIRIPEGVQTIGEFAFKDCVKLETVYIPNSLLGIGYGAFFGCTGLKHIGLSQTTEHRLDRDLMQSVENPNVIHASNMSVYVPGAYL